MFTNILETLENKPLIEGLDYNQPSSDNLVTTTAFDLLQLELSEISRLLRLRHKEIHEKQISLLKSSINNPGCEKLEYSDELLKESYVIYTLYREIDEKWKRADWRNIVQPLINARDYLMEVLSS